MGAAIKTGALWALVMLVGCSGGERQVGDVCSSVGQTMCERQKACDPSAPAIDDCVAVVVRDCCGALGVCERAPAKTQAAQDICEQDLAVASCGALAQRDLPDSCTAIGAPASALGAVEGSDDGPGTTSVTNGGTCEATGLEACRRAAECPTADGKLRFLFPDHTGVAFPTLADCDELYRSACTDGAVRVDLASCTDALASATCEAPSSGRGGGLVVPVSCQAH